LGEADPGLTLVNEGRGEPNFIPYGAHLGPWTALSTANIQPVIGAIIFELGTGGEGLPIKLEEPLSGFMAGGRVQGGVVEFRAEWSTEKTAN
jgi:hypothetical protein